MNNPSIKSIVNYWHESIDEYYLNFDWENAETHCWNCGDDKKSTSGEVRLQKCHIIPKSKGGGFHPSNYVLLCAHCHQEAPDIKCKNSMWNWIKSNKTKYFKWPNTYRAQKAIELYDKNHSISFFQTIASINQDFCLQKFKKHLDIIGTHSGRVKQSTYYYALVDFVEKYT